MSKGWLKFPRVVALYIPLFVMPAIPMFIADSGNPARALGWTMWLWIFLTIVSGVAGLVVAFADRLKDKSSDFLDTFHITFIISWIIVFGGILMLAKN